VSEQVYPIISDLSSTFSRSVLDFLVQSISVATRPTSIEGRISVEGFSKFHFPSAFFSLHIEVFLPVVDVIHDSDGSNVNIFLLPLELSSSLLHQLNSNIKQ
jgi:hypothetical protein